MSTKQQQGRKRKGRARERTVTTLTQDPNTQFLVPTATEEPAPPMSPAFSLASGGSTSSFQPQAHYSGFGYNNNFVPAMNGQQAPPPSQVAQNATQRPYQELPSSTGSSNADLDRLERLKKEILDGQNPYYKAVPQPDFLDSLYLGRSSNSQVSSIVPAHPEQVSNSAKSQQNNQQSRSGRENGFAATSASIRQDSQDQVPPIAQATSTHSDATMHSLARKSSQTLGTDSKGASHVSAVRGPIDKRSGGGLPPLSSASSNPPTGLESNDHSGVGGNDKTQPGSNGQGSVRPTAESTVDSPSASKGNYVPSASENKGDIRRVSERVWSRDQGSDERYGRRPPPYPDYRYDASRYPDSRYPDRDRERERERERAFERDRERDRDRRFDYRFDDRRIDNYPRGHDRRPPFQPDNRDQRPQDIKRLEPRLENPADNENRRPVPMNPPALEDRISRAPPVDDRQTRTIAPDDRSSSQSVILTDRPVRQPAPLSDRDTRPAVLERPLSPGSRDNRPRPSSDGRPIHAHPPVDNSSARAPVQEEHLSDRSQPALEQRIGGRVHPPIEAKGDNSQMSTVEARGNARSQPLQERISGRPTLEDRIGTRVSLADVEERGRVPASTPMSSEVDSRPNRSIDSGVGPPKPLLEERRIQQPVDARRPPQESIVPRSDIQPPRLPEDRLSSRPAPLDHPPARRPSSYIPDSRLPAAVHDSPHMPVQAPGVPSPRRTEPLVARDGYNERSASRSGASVYQRELERRYTDDRRVKVEPEEEFTQNRLVYSERVPALADDRVRPPPETHQWRKADTYAPAVHPPASDRHRVAPVQAESRDWIPNTDRSYRPDQYRDIPTPLVREPDRYAIRDAAKGIWETAPREDRRSSAPIPPPQHWERDEAVFRPNTGRPTDRYAGDDRARDLGRARYPPTDDLRPHAAHVRPRSPSPIRRGPDPIDEMRPLKRARESSPYYAPDYARAVPMDYQRPSSPAAVPGSFYESRPPSFAPRDGRNIPEYPTRDRHEAYYDRRGPIPPPRSPPYAGRGIYTRDDREDRNYGLPPRSA